ncbi:MAG: ABC transporter permease subunit [Rhodospirillales bacterium]|nr:ABC transporter permease subunit [Rhodospirillales bacterium]
MANPEPTVGRRVAERLIGEGVVVAALAAWGLFALGLPEFILPGPVAVFETLGRLFLDPGFAVHTLTSAVRVVVSVILALILGGGLAFLADRFPVLETIVHGRIAPVLNSFPSIGWAILAAIWFDVSSFAVIFVQVAILTPFCLINIAQGLREIDRDLVEMGRSFTRRERRVLLKVSLPLLLPYIVAALRIAYGIGWKIAIVSELLGADSGLGYLMLRAQTSADTSLVVATCLAIVFIFALGERLVIDPLARRVAQH